MDRILLLLDHKENRRLLESWLGRNYQVVPANTARLPDEPFDLGILDGPALDRLWEQVQGRREAEGPLFLPFLLITARQDVKAVTRHLWRTVDELILSPIEKVELQARVEMLLRARRLSLESERRYHALSESSLAGVVIVGQEGRILYANDTYSDICGYTREELLSLSPQAVQAMVHPDDQTRVWGPFQDHLAGKAISPRYEYRGIRKDGTVRWLEMHVGRIDYRGQPALQGIVVDVTEQVQAQEALRRALREWEEIFQAIGHPTIILSPQHKVMAANQAALKATGMTAEELAGKHCYEVFHGTSQPPEGCPIEKLMRSGRLETAEMDMESLDSIFLVSCTPVFDAKGELEKVIHIATDVTERIRAEEARRLLETAIDSAQECVMVSDRENRLTYVNRAFEKLTGYSAAEVLGKTPGILKSNQHDREFYQDLKSTIYSGRPWQGNLILKKKNGELYEVAASITPLLNASGQPDHFVSVHRDVTKEREIERRIQQSQRLEAIGTLAGGIAHDFNNILTPIAGYTQMCMHSLPRDSKIRENLEEVNQAAQRATDLVQQILSFSRRSNQERKPIRIALIIKEALKLLHAAIPTTIEIKQDISATEEAVIADPTEIHQVIMNLCTNASHAMPEGGMMSVGLHAVDLDREASKMIPGCTPGRYLKLSVEDTGHGIAPEILDKIFEPYFTTKKEGLGTGLGLATTHSIVTACGGGITVYSEPGKGTRFDLYFPVAHGVATKEAEKTAVIRGGHERILVVDDDIAVLNLHRKVLENYGYCVTTETDPKKALAIFEKSPADFDMVLTDMTMPGMTGDLVAAALLKIRPDLPVVVLTGFSERMNEDKAQELGIRRFLTKPVSVNDLLSTVRDILDAK